MKFQGLDIVIEWRQGEFRPFEDSQIPGAGMIMVADYGYFKDTISYEVGDELDVFLGKDEDAEYAYMAYLLNLDGTPNEVKVFLGFDSEDIVRELMGRQYSDDRVGPIVAIKPADLKQAIEEEKLLVDRQARDQSTENDLDELGNEQFVEMVEVGVPSGTEITTLGKAILVRRISWDKLT